MSSVKRAKGAAASGVLVIGDSASAGNSLVESQLRELGYEVAGVATDAERALWLYELHHPKMVVVDLGEEVDALPEVAVELIRRGAAGVVVGTSAEAGLVQSAVKAGAFGFLVKPLTTEAMRGQLVIALQRHTESRQLLAEKEELTQALETRRLVDRAKAIMMKRLNIPEADAHKRLQQESQKRRIGLGDLSRKIIDSEELLGGG